MTDETIYPSPTEVVCWTCRWSHGTPDDMHCRRYPPTTSNNYPNATIWPPVWWKDWCGEWSPANPVTVSEPT